ncbi:MAG: transposase [Syntrophales bacterium]
MDLKSFETLVRTENTARLLFKKLCWKNYRHFCIRCRSYKIYRIVGKRFRFKRRRYTFHDFSGRWINCNGVEGFWSYAKERLIKYHGVSKEKFPLYLKEMEFRYNNKSKPIFNSLAQLIVNLVPDRL